MAIGIADMGCDSPYDAPCCRGEEDRMDTRPLILDPRLLP